jgi:hypothetical protein
LCVEDVNPDYIPGVDDAPVKIKRTKKAAKAAPDMLEVLKWVTACLKNPHGGMDRLAAIEKAQDIIAKAEAAE